MHIIDINFLKWKTTVNGLKKENIPIIFFFVFSIFWLALLSMFIEDHIMLWSKLIGQCDKWEDKGIEEAQLISNKGKESTKKRIWKNKDEEKTTHTSNYEKKRHIVFWLIDQQFSFGPRCHAYYVRCSLFLIWLISITQINHISGAGHFISIRSVRMSRTTAKCRRRCVHSWKDSDLFTLHETRNSFTGCFFLHLLLFKRTKPNL